MIENQLYNNLDIINDTISDIIFVDCEFIDCKIIDTTINRCIFENCSFINCKVSGIKFNFCQVKELYIDGSTILQVNWSDISPVNSFIMPISNAVNSVFKYNSFTQLALNKLKMTNCEIIDTIYAECDLKQADFNNTKFKRTEFFKCDLRKANFSDADGYQIDIFNCNLKGAKFSFPDVCKLLDSLEIEYN